MLMFGRRYKEEDEFVCLDSPSSNTFPLIFDTDTRLTMRWTKPNSANGFKNRLCTSKSNDRLGACPERSFFHLEN